MAKLEIKKHTFQFPIKEDTINIKSLGDLHVSSSFPDYKFQIIKEGITSTPTDYVCFCGDNLDSSNFLYTDPKKRDAYLKFLEDLGKKYKVFINRDGGHDLAYLTKNWWKKDLSYDFWREVASINGIYLSNTLPFYEDEKVIIFNLEEPFELFYDNGKHLENKSILIDELNKSKAYLTNLNSDKLKILIIHSPILVTDLEILELIKEYDLILSGHMHNGMMLPILDHFFDGNKGILNNLFDKHEGLIAPNKSFRPDNARGVKEINIDGKTIYLIITSGITKLAESAKILSHFNFLYPMSMEDINVKKLIK